MADCTRSVLVGKALIAGLIAILVVIVLLNAHIFVARMIQIAGCCSGRCRIVRIVVVVDSDHDVEIHFDSWRNLECAYLV
jgi:hypothetical protein